MQARPSSRRPAFLAAALVFVSAVVAGLAWWGSTSGAAPEPARRVGASTAGRGGEETDAAVAPLSNAGNAPDATRRPAVPPAAGAGGPGLDVTVVLERNASPCAGFPVHVRQGNELTLRTARTDAEGTCSFDDVRPGRTLVLAAQRVSKVVTVDAGTRTAVTLTLPDGVDVRGRVLDARGAPVSGATVWLARGRNQRVEEGDDVASTDGDGRFALAAVVPGSVLAARASGYRSSPLESVAGSPGTVAEVTLTLAVRGGAVHGRVVDRRGNGVPGARLFAGHVLEAEGLRSTSPSTLRGRIPPRSTRTREDGTFFLDGLEEGLVHPIWVGKEGFAIACVRATPRAEELVIELLPEAVLSGVVEHADGTPAWAASVWLESRAVIPPRTGFSGPIWAQEIVPSDERGSFELRALPAGEGILHARLDDEKADLPISLRAGAIRNTRLVLGRSATVDAPALRGVVYDLAGYPARGMRVTVGSPSGVEAASLTDEDGRFAVRGAPPDASRLRVWDSATRWPHPVLEVERGGLWPFVQAELPYAQPAGALVGSAEPRGAEVALELTRDGYTRRLGTSSEGGRFRLHPLPAGRYEVVASIEGHGDASLGDVELGPGEEFDLGLVAPGGVGRLEVFLGASPPDSASLDGLVVHLTSASRDFLRTAEVTDGVAVIDELAAGPYTVAVWDPRVVLSTARASVRSGETARVELELDTGRAVRFRFLDRDEALSTLRLVWRADGADEPLWDMGLRSWTRPDLERFTLRLPAGDFVLEVFEPNGLASTTSFRVLEGAGEQEILVPRDDA